MVPLTPFSPYELGFTNRGFYQGRNPRGINVDLDENGRFEVPRTPTVMTYDDRRR